MVASEFSSIWDYIIFAIGVSMISFVIYSKVKQLFYGVMVHKNMPDFLKDVDSNPATLLKSMKELQANTQNKKKDNEGNMYQ